MSYANKMLNDEVYFDKPEKNGEMRKNVQLKNKIS